MVAKQINHYYWMHAPNSDHRIRIENVQRIVETMTKKKIIKKSVSTGGTIIRGMTERYADKALIYIRKEQSLEWQRYTAIKELCHIVYDEADDFEPDPLKTLEQLVLKRTLTLGEPTSPALLSERLAEITALEIIYPLEFRQSDAADLQAGRHMDDLVAYRQIPGVHIERGTDSEYIAACVGMWKILPEVSPATLAEF